MTTTKIVPIGSQRDLRDMLLSAGVGQYNAILSIPYMNFLPSTTDPYAQGVIQLAQALQRLLNMRGAQIDVDGGLGQETVAALMQYSGPLWYDRSWAQIMGDVMTGKPWPGWIRNSRVDDPAGRGGLGDDVTAYGVTVGSGVNDPLPLPMLTAPQTSSSGGGMMGFVTSPPGLALLAVGGYIAYDHFKGKRKNPARRRRRS